MRLDPVDRGRDRLAVGGGDLDRAVVVDVDLGAGLLDDLADDLAARADHFADLVDRDLDGLDARRVLAELRRAPCRAPWPSRRGCACGRRCAWSSATFMISSVMPAILMSICSEVTPSRVPATLKSMSPRWSSSPRMSERTAKRSPSLIRPMAMPATGALQRHAGVHQRQRGAADRRHRGRAVRLGDLRDDADRVGELVARRQHRMDGAPGELAVADLAAAGRAHAAGLADRVGREVVVQQEGLLVGALAARRRTARPRRCRAWRRPAPGSRRG